jgi:hypothetical protein
MNREDSFLRVKKCLLTLISESQSLFLSEVVTLFESQLVGHVCLRVGISKSQNVPKIDSLV